MHSRQRGECVTGTTLQPGNGTSALALLPVGVDSVGPRAYAHPEPIPASSFLDHALETKTPEVLVPVAPGPLARPVWPFSSSQGWAELLVCLLLGNGRLQGCGWCLEVQTRCPSIQHVLSRR